MKFFYLPGGQKSECWHTHGARVTDTRALRPDQALQAKTSARTQEAGRNLAKKRPYTRSLK